MANTFLRHHHTQQPIISKQIINNPPKWYNDSPVQVNILKLKTNSNNGINSIFPNFATNLKDVEITLRDLIAEGEYQALNFNDLKKTRSLAAFTNTDGGRLRKTSYHLIYQTTKPLP
jgi:hypothetical protein